MLALAGMTKRMKKEDPFFQKSREKIDADELELLQLITDQEKVM